MKTFWICILSLLGVTALVFEISAIVMLANGTHNMRMATMWTQESLVTTIIIASIVLILCIVGVVFLSRRLTNHHKSI